MNEVEIVTNRLLDAIDRDLLYEVVKEIASLSKELPKKDLSTIVEMACQEWDV